MGRALLIRLPKSMGAGSSQQFTHSRVNPTQDFPAALWLWTVRAVSTAQRTTTAPIILVPYTNLLAGTMARGKKGCSTVSKVEATEAVLSATWFLTRPEPCMARPVREARAVIAAGFSCLPTILSDVVVEAFDIASKS